MRIIISLKSMIKQRASYLVYQRIKSKTLAALLEVDECLIRHLYKEVSNIRFDVPGQAGALDTIYVIIRLLKSSVVVETGVASGVSSFFILLALKRNNHGHLYSIDMPGLDPSAPIPQGKEVGWVVPNSLRDRWSLVIGRVEDKLPQILESLQAIDIFYHDSCHTYEHMTFEFNLALRYLRREGLLIADNTDLNSAFYDFCSKHSCRYTTLANVGFCLKR